MARLRSGARLAVVAALVGMSLVGMSLVGCTPSAPTGSPPPTSLSPGASGTASPTPAGTPAPDVPIIRPGSSAAANKQYFDYVNSTLYAASGMADGRTIIDTLVAAGFRKQDMEVTQDVTSIGLAVDSIVFAVRVKGECLVGQFSATGYRGEIAPLLGTGGCLIGFTRPIDW